MATYQCNGCGHKVKAEFEPMKCGHCGDTEQPVFSEATEPEPAPKKGKK